MCLFSHYNWFVFVNASPKILSPNTGSRLFKLVRFHSSSLAWNQRGFLIPPSQSKTKHKGQFALSLKLSSEMATLGGGRGGGRRGGIPLQLTWPLNGIKILPLSQTLLWWLLPCAQEIIMLIQTLEQERGRHEYHYDKGLGAKLFALTSLACQDSCSPPPLSL